MTKKEEATKKSDTSEVDEKKVEKKKKSKEELKVLYDLVEASGIEFLSIIMDLSKNGLVDQYYTEEKLREKGIPITPTITEAEFKKIIGD